MFQEVAVLPRGAQSCFWKCVRKYYFPHTHTRFSQWPLHSADFILDIQHLCSNFYGDSLVPPLVKKPPAMQETWVGSLDWEDPLEKGKATTPVFWPGEFYGPYNPWRCKELDMTEWLSLLWWLKKFQSSYLLSEREKIVSWFSYKVFITVPIKFSLS